MSLRFRKSIKLAPGIRFNVGLGGTSWTIGPRGASVNIGKRGTYLNTGIPGTGLSTRTHLSGSSEGSMGSSRSSGKQMVDMTVTVGVDDDGNLYFKDSNGVLLSDALIAAAKKQNKAAIEGLIERKCHEINEQVESLGRLHWETPNSKVRPHFQAPSFETDEPRPPIDKVPTWFQRWFQKKQVALIAKVNEGARAQFAFDHERWEKELAAYTDAVAKRKFLVEQQIYEDVAAMDSFLEGRLSEIEWPRETAVSFDILPDGSGVHVDVDLPELEDLPTKTASVPSRGLRLSVKEMPAAKLHSLYSDHVHSLIFRVIGEIFAALPRIQKIVISGYTDRRSAQTGEMRQEYVISVGANRIDWERIDFDGLEAISPQVALGAFEIRREQLRSGYFKAITPIT